MKINWKKIIIVLSDAALAFYLFVAFTSFNKPEASNVVCKKVNICINDGESNGFINAKEIKKRLEAAAIYPYGKHIEDINTRQIEEKLKRSPFVKTSECYKTTDGQVFISITQRLPVIRIKAENGDDYYIDDKSSIMPNSTYTSDLIIATGHINRTFAITYLSQMGKTLMANDFWRNLIEQIHVIPNNAIELVPRVGDHVVYLGQLPERSNTEEREKAIDEFITTKMTRLEKFYRYGLSHAGWNKYAIINIEFDNQIICKRHSDTPNTFEMEPQTGDMNTAQSNNLAAQTDSATAQSQPKSAAKPTQQAHQKQTNIPAKQNKKTS